jgi:hypothetical protein
LSCILVAVVLCTFVVCLLEATVWSLAVAAVVAVVAVLTGPYAWAKALRHRTGSPARECSASVAAAVTRRPDGATVACVVAQPEVLAQR